MDAYRVPAYFKENNYASQPGILDVLSVLSGFRKVGLIGLLAAERGMPQLEKQVSDVDTIAKTAGKFSTALYMICGGRCGVFVFAEEARRGVLAFIRRFPTFPDVGEKGDYALGILLGYPKCCVEYGNRFDFNDINSLVFATKIANKFPLIPFVPHSEKCAEPWQRHYEGLLAKVVWV